MTVTIGLHTNDTLLETIRREQLAVQPELTRSFTFYFLLCSNIFLANLDYYRLRRKY